jgi:hypothetical protein
MLRRDRAAADYADRAGGAPADHRGPGSVLDKTDALAAQGHLGVARRSTPQCHGGSGLSQASAHDLIGAPAEVLVVRITADAKATLRHIAWRVNHPRGRRTCRRWLSSWWPRLAGGLPKLIGPGGLVMFTKQVLEGALETELDDHLGMTAASGLPAATSATAAQRGRCAPMPVRSASACPGIAPARSLRGAVPKHARRLAGFDEAVLSLYAKEMTSGDIANPLD